MLSEKQLDDLLAIFLKRTQSVVEEYLIRMGEQIQDIGKLIPSSINRLVQLKRMNANMDAIKREIARLAEISMEDLEKIFAAAAESDARFVAEKFGNEYKTPILENYALQQILKAQLRVTLNEMANISRTRISSIAYQNAVDKAIQAAQMGVEDYNKAVRRALSEAAEAGIRMEIGHTGAYEKRIGYGGRYTRRLDSAVRQNVLDGIRSLNNEVLAQAGEEFGADGVEISAHMLCAEDHLPYQGRQFSNARFLEIQEEELDRPFGMWNCRHSIYPIILGVSRPTYTEEELAAFERNSKERIEIDGVTKTRYQWTQEQRRIETAVRRQKDVAVAFKASGDMQGRREVQANINVLMEKYKGISEKINVKQQYDRMRVDGFSAVKARNQLADSERFKNASFATQKAFESHARKHLHEYGDITPDEYLANARELLQSSPSDDIMVVRRSDGSVSKYRVSTNDFVASDDKWNIRTAFKPKNGIEYWREEVERNKQTE